MGRGRKERNEAKCIYIYSTEDSVQKQRAKKSQGAAEEEQDGRTSRSYIETNYSAMDTRPEVLVQG